MQLASVSKLLTRTDGRYLLRFDPSRDFPQTGVMECRTLALSTASRWRLGP